MDVLTLTCWIRSPNHTVTTFPVKTSKTETVSDLQEVIKNKKPVTFRDVDAATLALYKPNNPISPPYKDHLCEFNLSAHGEFLEDWQKLSEVFPEQPPVPGIHVIVDAPQTIICWLRGTTLDSRFEVMIPQTKTVYDLKEAIKNKKLALRDVDAHTLRLFRISGDDDNVRESLHKMGDGEPLQGSDLVPIFLGMPVLDSLFVVVEVSATGGGIPTLVRQLYPGGDRLQDYEDIFIRVKNWGKFEQSDIERNWIKKVQDMDILPDFVTTFERELVRKPRLSVGVRELYMPDALGTYFDCSEDPSQEEVRFAGPSEVTHTTHVALHEWQSCWQSNGSHRRPLKGYVMDLIFFGVFLVAEDRASGALKDKKWPITVVMKRDNDNELRQYCPRSHFLISNSSFPRLLVEVNSTSQYSWPMDLIRMLTTGAFIVRFANRFVSTFREKNFVLCAVFIWDDGRAIRYTLFQNQNDETVYYKEQQLSLNVPHGRAEFARYLYNLLSVELDQDQDSTVKDAIRELHSRIDHHHLKSFYTKNPTGHGSKKRSRTDNSDNDGAGGRGGDDHARLRAHGYEVKPEVIVDASGGEWKPLYQAPDHILTVYRPTKSNEEFIAKKVRKDSNELDILKLLDTMRLKSDLSPWSIHVISLVDSFYGWAILPKMATLEGYLDFRPKVFESKVPQVCLGLIKGLAYLHKHCIAHRDIKPDNLVVDENFNLKIIDFDVAMEVEDEDEEVDDQCGTEYWVAPEVEEKLRHSPIRADRWACGRVIQSLLDWFSKEDDSLRAFSRDLVAHNPKQRPSLLGWGRYLAPPPLDARNIDARTAGWPRRDRMEVDEDTRPPNVKKQRPM